MSDSLCVPCARIVVNDERHLDKFDRRLLGSRENKPHHENLAELKKCAEDTHSGCPLCRLFMAAIERNTGRKYLGKTIQDYIDNWGDNTFYLGVPATLSYRVNLVADNEDEDRGDVVERHQWEQTLAICPSNAPYAFGALAIYTTVGMYTLM
jgi:hypothetical protein